MYSYIEIDALGYAAAAMTLLTFAQTQMATMRVCALAANVLFVSYGLLGQFYPVAILHLVLLPLNLLCLSQTISKRVPRSKGLSLVEVWKLSRGQAGYCASQRPLKMPGS